MEDTFPCESKASLSWGKATLPDGIFSEKYEEFYSVDYESQMAVNLNIPHELLNEPVGKIWLSLASYASTYLDYKMLRNFWQC